MTKFFPRLFLISLFISAISIFPEAISAEDNKETEQSKKENMIELLDLFGDVIEKIREEYVEIPDDKKLIEAAINGMLTDLDPHSSYINEESFGEMQVQTKGEFGGLGIEVTMKNGLVYVVSPIDDTPAFEAGIQAGDYISHINDESVIGMTIKDAVSRMRGEPETKVTLTIIREGEDEPFDVELTRDVIKIKSVKSRIEGDVGYIRITSFTEQTDAGLEKEIEKVKKEIGKDMKGIVLDLRSNPGGLLNEAIAVADTFLDRGEIVSTRGRETSSIKRYNATKGDMIEGLPMVVLINSGSASASEIVAGALKDHKRGVVMGTKSFGKGSVQTVIPLPKGGAMRLTTSRYYTPSGISIQAEGITPDIEVLPGKVEYTKISKLTTEADLKGHLANKDKDKDKKDSKDKKKEEKKKSDKSDKESKTKDKKNGDKKEDKKDQDKDTLKKEGEKESDEKVDLQLERALDLIHGIYIYNHLENNTQANSIN